MAWSEPDLFGFVGDWFDQPDHIRFSANEKAVCVGSTKSFADRQAGKAVQFQLLLEALVLGLIEIFFHDRIFELFRFVHHEGFVTPPRNDIVESLLFALVQNGVELQWKGRFNDLGWCWCGFVVTARRLRSKIGRS